MAAPGRRALSYERLAAHISATVRALNELGIGRGDRVAVVLPNGPEMATAFLGVASAAACAPLNPTYPVAELEYYLSDLRARALVTTSVPRSPARMAADRLGIPVIGLAPRSDAEAGLFDLEAPAALRAASSPGAAAEPDDIALLLHTSGTTSRPKLVPLTHRNLAASASNVARAIELCADDRCLNIMPLFHIHGLVGALLASLTAGSAIVCSPGFVATEVFDWMRDTRPTWYTAVPTMHQGILSRAQGAAPRMRVVRSSSAALPTRVAAELEAAFGCPVIEAYGMTEGAHQIASNPLPPRARKPGSVGLPAGPEVAIMGGDGSLLPPTAQGEVVIRGPSVTRGYLGDAGHNQAAFCDGWFRTGDQGYLDADGYLFLTGRLKEQINRGGEKVSPLEIDDILTSHRAVARAVTFAMPDPRLGEEVAAAVVLRDDDACTEDELKAFVAERLADFKVPRRVIFVREIPLGPTGKMQRIGLAERLGVTSTSTNTSTSTTEAGPPAYVAPRTPIERDLAEVWTAVLRVDRVGVDDDFFQLGGDSILATRVIARLREHLAVDLTPRSFFEAPTVAALAAVVSRALSTRHDVEPLITEIAQLSDEEAERLLAMETSKTSKTSKTSV